MYPAARTPMTDRSALSLLVVVVCVLEAVAP
jgi:hypothetical protein